MTPLTIGLTGGMGAGKSTVAALLAELGATVVTGDELGRAAVDSSPHLLDALRERFGTAVFTKDNTLDRRALGQLVFASPVHSRWLTDITFPAIFDLWLQAIERCAADVIVFDAAMIFEWQIENRFDLLVVTHTVPEMARQRLRSTHRFTDAEITDRLSRQLAPEYKTQRADVVIFNNGTQENLKLIVQQIWQQQILPLIYSKHHPSS